MDGGIRSGQHIFKALALGATATLIGRSYIYGLGAMGQSGVTKALQILRNELDLTMAFCGLRDIHEVSDKVIWRSN
jgi:L-lactate dehydrogenase (cytochrome)